MIREYLTVAGRIRTEIVELPVVVRRAEEALQGAERSGDQLYLDAAALNLHAFYSGIEHLFEVIAEGVDDALPHGDRWHQDLLRQMASPVPQVRNAVITPATRDLLVEFLGFRHVVRNVYSFRLDPARVARLVRLLAHAYPAVRDEVLAFADHLEAVSAADDADP